jgi:succinate dehydrogenase flavin-adding protein (antitoxin of CptAB toxin-antitoxin module)
MVVSISMQEENILLKKIIYRARYRGSLELDLVFKKFFDTYGESLTEEEIESFSFVLDSDDLIILGWLRGELSLPHHVLPSLLQKLKACFKNP